MKPLAAAVAMRAIWWALALVHVAPLWSVTSRVLSAGLTPANALSLAALLAALACFTIKALGLRLLPWSLSRTQVLCLLLGATLLHRDLPLERSVTLTLSEVPAAAVLASFLEAARRSPRWLPTLRDALRRLRFQRLLPLPSTRLFAPAFVTPITALRCLPRIPRAPPG